MSSIPNKKNGVSYVLVNTGQAGRRLDNFLMGTLSGVPRSRIYQMIRKGEVRVNKGRSRPEYRVSIGDKVRVPPLTTVATPAPAALPERQVEEIIAHILYQDANVIVLNKPSGLVVHSGSGRTFGVIDLLRSGLPGGRTLQLVHRLDRDTSGCLLISKNSAYLRYLHDGLRRGGIRKQYLTLLAGVLSRPAVTVDRPLERNLVRGGERVSGVAESGRRAVTRFTVVRRYRNSTLCRVATDTGRTHQIRVHAKFLGHPVAGDEKYGHREFNRELRRHGLGRLFLHAAKITVPDPGGKTGINVEAPLPDELKEFLSNWR